MICPAQVDTCTEGLLRDAFSEANRRGLPYQTHAAQSLAEFHEIVRRHGKTPIEWLDFAWRALAAHDHRSRHLS